MADEPTGNLDSKTAELVCDLFESLVRQGKTIVMVTHDRDLAARATRSVAVVDGDILADADVAAIHQTELEAFGA
jgi:ABC-type lipoprotein export system ATPase subunit